MDRIPVGSTSACGDDIEEIDGNYKCGIRPWMLVFVLFIVFCCCCMSFFAAFTQKPELFGKGAKAPRVVVQPAERAAQPVQQQAQMMMQQQQPQMSPGLGGVPSRMQSEAEGHITQLPSTDWRDIIQTRGCTEELLQNPGIIQRVPKIAAIVSDIQAKVVELDYIPVPVKLSADCAAAIVAYTHDLGTGQREGNLYYELNSMLRKRMPAERSVLLEVWGDYMHYMMTGLEKLPDYRGECWRGYNHGTRAQILEQYAVGRPIQWGAFTSVTTDKSAAKAFAPETRVIFKITVTSGRDINAYSFFPQEGEILLSPSHRFTVST